ncbi:MAG: class I SAM-dependent methyltransferase [Candidatus Rokuibacteriota bacterium]|nr:MAG: class I SAM-dependent methyltransferase [Candidatus Rokubacteria bacterium]
MSFGAVAETYDRVRPRYLLPLLDRAQQALDIAPTARVLDLGAGTGRLTRELVARFAGVVAVEPDEEMRGLLEAGTVLAGTAEAIPLDDDSVDAVFAGEAFHWFDAGSAIAEIARVLRPRGGLAVISTHWWETEPALPESALTLLRQPFTHSSDQRRSPRWEAFTGSPFEPLRYDRFEEEITVDVDALLALYSTTSALAAMQSDERVALLATVRLQIPAGSYHLPIKHELCWTRLA